MLIFRLGGIMNMAFIVEPGLPNMEIMRCRRPTQ